MSLALDTPDGASKLTESLVFPLGDRWLHAQEVAPRAQQTSWAVPAG
ncbi:hypothetical protein OG698_17975 [Streptomyces sp. NBC_01003]|nr:hypothetical protein OG698_17975 [Streptomyces sp. NBC_01003]